LVVVITMSSSSSSSSSALAAALGTPPVQTLTRTNYFAWKALVLPAFRGAHVMGLLDGTDHAPSKILEVEDANKKRVMVENPTYVAWIARDQRVRCFLLNSLSLMTHKYRGSQQSSREVLPKFIDSTQGEPKNICKP
jgi:hypothetical protein